MALGSKTLPCLPAWQDLPPLRGLAWALPGGTRSPVELPAQSSQELLALRASPRSPSFVSRPFWLVGPGPVPCVSCVEAPRLGEAPRVPPPRESCPTGATSPTGAAAAAPPAGEAGAVGTEGGRGSPALRHGLLQESRAAAKFRFSGGSKRPVWDLAVTQGEPGRVARAWEPREEEEAAAVSSPPGLCSPGLPWPAPRSGPGCSDHGRGTACGGRPQVPWLWPPHALRSLPLWRSPPGCKQGGQ